MALYAFFLAGSNYFAPVICGFIAEYQGWQWVFYWPSIFCAFAIVFLFFFMEETNYVREKAPVAEVTSTEASSRTSEQGDKEKRPADVAQQSDTECGVMYQRKTYLQKLSLVGPRLPRNNMFRRFYHTLYYLSWPVVFYAGYVFLQQWVYEANHGRFSYGSYLIWFNVLNGTASIILGGAPYNFRYVALFQIKLCILLI